MRTLLVAVAGLTLLAGAAAAEPPALPPGFQAGFAVTIDAPETFSAGTPVGVSGFVYAVVGLPVVLEVAQGVPNLDVELILDGNVVQKKTTGGAGQYQFSVMLGADYPTTHTIQTVVLRGNAVLESSSRTITTNIDRFITELRLFPSQADVSLGGSLGLRACALYDDGRVRDVTEFATWTTADAGVASVSNDAATKGVVTGVAVGTTTVSAGLENDAATASITVVDGPGSTAKPCSAF